MSAINPIKKRGGYACVDVGMAPQFVNCTLNSLAPNATVWMWHFVWDIHVHACSTRRRSIQSADTTFSFYLPCRSQITSHSLAGCNDKTNNKNGPLVRRGGAIYRPAGGSFSGSFLGRSTGRWYPLGVSGCTAGWQRSVPAPAGGRRRHLGAGCYITPPIERLRPRSCSGQERSLHKGFVEGWNLVG